MTKCNTLNVKFSNSQLNKLKYGIKNGTEVTLNLSSRFFPDIKIIFVTGITRKNNEIKDIIKVIKPLENFIK